MTETNGGWSNRETWLIAMILNEEMWLGEIAECAVLSEQDLADMLYDYYSKDVRKYQNQPLPYMLEDVQTALKRVDWKTLAHHIYLQAPQHKAFLEDLKKGN